MIVLSHLPFWVWYLVIGLVIGLILVNWYRSLPKWARLGMFVFSVALWPVSLIVWLAYEVIVKSKPTRGN